MNRAFWITTFAKALLCLVGAFAFGAECFGAPATAAFNAGTAAGQNTVKPEPKEYAGAGGGGSASSFVGSGGEKCHPLPPKGPMTFAGGGEIILDGKVIDSLVIGDGASKPEFAWLEDPLSPIPRPKNAPPPTQWICGGGAAFETGFSYNVTVAFLGSVAPCGAITTVATPASVSGGIFVPSNAAGSGTIYLPKIRTTTAATAKSNSNGWRKKIGVGEVVGCSLQGAPGGCIVTWTATGSGCTITGSGYSATFVAGDVGGTATVTAAFSKTFPASEAVSGSSSVNLEIVEPENETAVKVSWGPPVPAYSPRMGAGMTLHITVNPTDVSFSRVEAKEMPGPATNKIGLFATRYPAPTDLFHVVADVWITLTSDNMWDDDAWFREEPLPWQSGSFEWIIPVRWRVLTFSAEHALPNRPTKIAILNAAGAVSVSKLGQTEEQTP